jgi:hypothetical protein
MNHLYPPKQSAVPNTRRNAATISTCKDNIN